MTGQEWHRVRGGNGSREGKGRRLGGEDGGQKGWKERKRRKKGWMEGTKGRTEGSGQGTDGRDGRAGGGQGRRALGAVKAAGRSQGSSRTEQEQLQHLQHHRGPSRCQPHAHATRPWPPGHGGSTASTHSHRVLALPEVPRGLRPPARWWPRHTSRPSPWRCHHGGRHQGGCHGQHQGQRHRVLHHGQRPQWPRRVALLAIAGDPVGHAMARHRHNPAPCPGARSRGYGSSAVSRLRWRLAARSAASPEGAAAPTLTGTPPARGSGATVPGHGSRGPSLLHGRCRCPRCRFLPVSPPQGHVASCGSPAPLAATCPPCAGLDAAWAGTALRAPC